MQATYTARREVRRDGAQDFAEVTVRADPCPGPSAVVLLPAVLKTLRRVFGSEFAYHRHCVRAAVAVQINTINIKEAYPRAGGTSFRAEVVEVRLSRDAGREVSGALLTVAGMDAIAAYLIDWEQESGQVD